MFSSIWKKKIYKRQDELSIFDLEERVMEPELLLINLFVKPDDIVFDIGANIGEYTYEFEKLSQAKNVFAFEPNERLSKRLKRLFRKCNILEIALSDSMGISDFKIPIIKSVKYNTRGSLNTEFIEQNETNHIIDKVKTTTIDKFIERHPLKRLDFIKIDVEGHENQLIKGAEKTLEKLRPTLLVEIEQRHHTENIKIIFDAIVRHGYCIYFYNHNKIRFEPLSNFIANVHQLESNIKTFEYINNFFCIHQSKKTHLAIVEKQQFVDFNI